MLRYLPVECQQVQEICDVQRQAALRREHQSGVFEWFGGVGAEVFRVFG